MRFPRILSRHGSWIPLVSLAMLAGMTTLAWGAGQALAGQGATPQGAGLKPMNPTAEPRIGPPEAAGRASTATAAPSADASSKRTALPLAGAGGTPAASIGICPISTATMACTLAWKQPINSTNPTEEIVPLTNSGTALMNIQSISTVSPFSVTDNCGTSLAAGASCNIKVSATTSQLCEFDEEVLTIVDDAGTQTVDLTVYGADDKLQVKDLNNPTVTVADLVSTLLGPGVSVSNIKYTGAPIAAGTFTGGTNVLGFESGIILSDGSANNTIGPNCSSGITGVNEQPGDTDLSGLIGGGVTNDAAILEFDFIPTASTLTFQYVWASDEYPEYVYSFNDVFGFFVNGTNVALVPGTDLPVSINNVNGGNPIGTNPMNAQFYLNNDFQYPLAEPFDTEMDGLTVVLTAQTTVNPGVTNHIKLGVADATDFVFDSNVFLKAASISSSQVTLYPPTLGFGDQGVGTTSTAQTVKVTNNGETAVTISNIGASGNFSATNVDCPESPSTLASAASCTISVTFKPLTSGLLNGALTVTDNANGSSGSMQTVPLSGTGTGSAPSAGVSPLTLPFGTQPANTTSGSKPVTLSNTGSSALTISNITTSANFGENNNCAGSVAAGGMCTINVTFSPTAATPYTGMLTITNNSGGVTGSMQTVSLSGTGTSNAPLASVSPLTLPFGTQPPETTSGSLPVTLSNTGTSALTIANITASANFNQTNTCAGSVAAGKMCTINVTFSPTAVGPFTGTLTITDNSGGVAGSMQTVSLSGTGGTGPAAASFSPASLAFQHNLNLQCPSKPLILSNTGGSTLHISSYYVQGAFAITANACGTTLPPGMNCQIDVGFTGEGVGKFNGTLTVTDDAANNPQVAPLKGQVFPACPMGSPTTVQLIVRGTPSTTFDLQDTEPSCHTSQIWMACTNNAPATCAFNPRTISPGGSTVLTLQNLNALTTDNFIFTAQGTDITNTTGINLSVVLSDFAFTTYPTSATVTAGQTANYAMTISPVNALSGTIQMGCQGAPSGTTCSVTPATVTLAQNYPAQVSVAVTTVSRSMGSPQGGSPFPGPGASLRLWLEMASILTLIGLVGWGAMGSRRTGTNSPSPAYRRMRVSVFAVAALALMLMAWAACGGGGSGGGISNGVNNPANSGTPAGSYSLTVTGTYDSSSGQPTNLVHTQPLTLQVN